MRSNVLVSLLLLSSSVGCDQVTKRAATEWLLGQPVRSYLGDTFRLLYIENTGAFLGMGATWPELVRFIVFTLASSTIVVLALAWLLTKVWSKDPSPNWITIVGSVLLLAGGLGNLVDRVLRDGAVIDFMNVGIGPLRSGIFNVADVQIVLGLAILVWRGRSEPKSGSSAEMLHQNSDSVRGAPSP
jgi:signal peptidase II